MYTYQVSSSWKNITGIDEDRQGSLHTTVQKSLLGMLYMYRASEFCCSTTGTDAPHMGYLRGGRTTEWWYWFHHTYHRSLDADLVPKTGLWGNVYSLDDDVLCCRFQVSALVAQPTVSLYHVLGTEKRITMTLMGCRSINWCCLEYACLKKGED